MCHDVAISPEVFHWESQSTTAVDTTPVQRYIHHQEKGSEVLLFVRDEKRHNSAAAQSTTVVARAALHGARLEVTRLFAVEGVGG